MPKKFYGSDNMKFLNGTVFSSVLIGFLQPDFESDENPKGGRILRNRSFLLKWFDERGCRGVTSLLKPPPF